MADLITLSGRRAAVMENAALQVAVLEGGGHIARVLDKSSAINPLWVPPWPSLEPGAFRFPDAARYGGGVDARLLASIMGHNLCVDIFGGPSSAEAAAGLTPHGEASIATYDFEGGATHLVARADLPLAQLRCERRLELVDRVVRVQESIENLSGTDRPIAWTEHVTLGPPFLERGITTFRASATQSIVYGGAFGTDDYLRAGESFEWPLAPGLDGTPVDLQRFTERPVSSGYTAHLMNPDRPDAFVAAFNPRLQLVFGYIWRTSDFPWLGLWEENHSRTGAPWNGQTLTRGLEFGVSPFPESRREMIDRGRLFGVPTYRWIPARTTVSVEYAIVCRPAAEIPDELTVA